MKLIEPNFEVMRGPLFTIEEIVDMRELVFQTFYEGKISLEVYRLSLMDLYEMYRLIIQEQK